ncbi:MAG: hypothetical protein GXO47_09895 [Chlorobi bacterium]|nr:hypothetical protein [Chlorobiota bacterium]
MDLIYKKDIKINAELCDTKGYMKLPALLDLLQSAAGEHADLLHFGIRDLNKGNDTWVLSRLRIEIDKWPTLENVVTLKTWPKGIERLFAVRNFTITDNKETTLIKASSYWIIIDRETKRPKIPSDTFQNREYPDLPATDKKPDKIPALKTPEYSSTITVSKNEIDINGHVNNVWYGQWLINTLPENIKTEMQISCFEINYLAEVFEGETLNITLGKSNDNSRLILGNIKRDNKEVCRAKILFT